MRLLILSKIVLWEPGKRLISSIFKITILSLSMIFLFISVLFIYFYSRVGSSKYVYWKWNLYLRILIIIKFILKNKFSITNTEISEQHSLPITKHVLNSFLFLSFLKPDCKDWLIFDDRDYWQYLITCVKFNYPFKLFFISLSSLDLILGSLWLNTLACVWFTRIQCLYCAILEVYIRISYNIPGKFRFSCQEFYTEVSIADSVERGEGGGKPYY